MTRTASLGMYDPPSLHAANDELWSLIAERLTRRGVADVPGSLDRDRPLEAIWSDPDLLLAQCCGYPLVTRYRGRLHYLATPRYAAPGCTGASYRSRIVVRANEPGESLAAMRGRRVAINQRDSNSGMNVLRAALAPLAVGAAFFAEVIETGSHAASLVAVAEGAADMAAIDTVSFAHCARDRPDVTARVRTIGWTEDVPGLPFVTSITTPEPVVRLLREALITALEEARTTPVGEALLLDGVERLDAAAYEQLLRLERDAVRQRYPLLA